MNLIIDNYDVKIEVEALNYAYGIMYGIVESSLLRVGLDPYMGIMHTNRYQQPALAFDHIEPFRPWADKLIVELIITQQIADSDLELNEEKLYRINKKARVVLIDRFFALMEERAILNGKRIKRIDHIHHASKQLVLRIKQQQNVP